MTALYAHTNPNSSNPEDWQSLKDHLDIVAVHAAKHAEVFDSSSWAFNAGLLHDLGKADAGFQQKLFDASGVPFPGKSNNSRVNHSNAGAAYAENHFHPSIVGRTLAYIVAGHHAGLPDYFNGWAKRLDEAKANLEQTKKHSRNKRKCCRRIRAIFEAYCTDELGFDITKTKITVVI